METAIAKTQNTANTSGIVAFVKTTGGLEKIREMEKQRSVVKISEVLLKNSVLMGVKNELDGFIVEDLMELILTRFNELSIEEIDVAFKWERYGVYGAKNSHFGLFDSNYVSDILKKYKEHVSLTRKSNNIKPQHKEISVSEKEKKDLVFNGIKKCFDFYLKNGKMEDNSENPFGRHIFTVLVKIGMLPQKGKSDKADEKYRQIYEAAKAVFLEKYNTPIKSNREVYIKKIKNEIKQIRQGESDSVQALFQIMVCESFFEKNKKEVEFMQRIEGAVNNFY